MKTWLVIDSHYLCHRAYHTSKELSWRGRSTGVIFGFLKAISALKDEFQTDDVAFCFEHPHLFRRDVYPQYKHKRTHREYTEEERQSYESFSIQVTELRKRYLPKIGFRNVFCFRGMESDDIMAAIAAGRGEDEVILVTADSDLYQCLDASGVRIWSPQKRALISEHSFRAQYGVSPRRWALVKAIAGCSGDEVAGIRGVGELTALRYFRGELKETSAAYQSIRSAEGQAIVRRNKQLVKLPYHSCPEPFLQQDQLSRAAWLEVCGALGMRTLAGRMPVATRKMR